MRNLSFCLSKADVKYFMAIDGNFDPKGKYWGFVCDSRENKVSIIERDFFDRITYGVYDLSGGCYLEMSMTWKQLSGEFVPQMKAYP